MAVVKTTAMDSEIAVIGFAANATTHSDAFVLINIGRENSKKINVKVTGGGKTFRACRTTDKEEQYKPIGEFTLENDVLVYEVPRLSVTTFFAK